MRIAHFWATSRVLAFTANLNVVIRNSEQFFWGAHVRPTHGVRLFLSEFQDVDRNPSIEEHYF
jgi:hypothetical protein